LNNAHTQIDRHIILTSHPVLQYTRVSTINERYPTERRGVYMRHLVKRDGEPFLLTPVSPRTFRIRPALEEAQAIARLTGLNVIIDTPPSTRLVVTRRTGIAQLSQEWETLQRTPGAFADEDLGGNSIAASLQNRSLREAKLSHLEAISVLDERAWAREHSSAISGNRLHLFEIATHWAQFMQSAHVTARDLPHLPYAGLYFADAVGSFARTVSDKRHVLRLLKDHWTQNELLADFRFETNRRY
jgi:hypothetical protein